jgi:hypothetical protein
MVVKIMAESDWKSTLISKSTDVFYIIVTILGIAIVLVAILGGVAYKNAIPPMDALTRGVLGVFGLAFDEKVTERAHTECEGLCGVHPPAASGRQGDFRGCARNDQEEDSNRPHALGLQDLRR